MGPGKPLKPSEVLLAAVLDLDSTPLETDGAISDDTAYIIMTRDNWRKVQSVIDKLDVRPAFKAAGASMFPILKEHILDPNRVYIKVEADG
jgi:hypothetical protein